MGGAAAWQARAILSSWLLGVPVHLTVQGVSGHRPSAHRAAGRRALAQAFRALHRTRTPSLPSLPHLAPHPAPLPAASSPRPAQGAASHALWQAWALMESKQGDSSLVRPLFQRGLSVSPRSRYTFLSWALWEKAQGNLQEARRLLKEGAERNPRDAAILQVRRVGGNGLWE